MHIDFPAELPVSARRDEIAAAIRDHQVVIVAGETGSGKTTQLPKIALALGRGRPDTPGGAMIGHTQPRRIAARSVAERIAEELGTELGDAVGYQVRFTDRTSRQSRVKVMTDGILLAELQRDRDLRRYDTLIIDEAHERSLNVDFILGYLKRLLPRRPDLKVVITSATIDPDRFARHFATPDGRSAPIIEVSGRTYPVDVRYRPLLQPASPPDASSPDSSGQVYDEDGEPVQRDQTEAIEAAVDELCRDTPGDILVFLPGEREIRDTADALKRRSHGPRGFDIVPLYSRLSAAEQHRVFERHARRRVVLATNVAETSLTVPGITAVIDTGVARISRWSTRTKVQRLPIEPISRASAQQRSGRCGRVEAGIAIRLYSEEDFEGRPEFTEPEILRTSLASVILQMTSLGLGQVERFPFVDPPDQRAVRAGVQLLEELGALVSTSSTTPSKSRGPRLTKLGRRIARLPIDPRLARMILEADRLGCVRDVLVVTAALSIQDPRERPEEHRAHADQLHARFRDPRSDFMTWLNLWRHLRTQQKDLGSSAFRRSCRQEHLNYLRVREWQEFESQLRQVAKEVGISVGPPTDSPDEERIHQALLSGLLSHIGLRDPSTGSRGDYLGARGTRFAVFPGSGLFKRPPDLVMAAELVETSRLWGRQVAAIDPLWAERLGGDLVKRQYAEPHWSTKRSAAMAHERVTLYGVPLVADRLVALGTRDAELARELFIRHALVQREWHQQHRFLATNQRLLEEAEELEHRARRRGIVVDEHSLFDFYDARVPPEIVSGAHFDSWWKQERRERPDLLTFDPEMLVHEGSDLDEADYPDAWHEGGASLPLRYHFEPGSEDDGVTVDVPLATLNTVGPAAFTWNVPGLRHELVTALIRSLPKPLRVNFVPAPDVAHRFLEAVPPGEEPLLEALTRYLRSLGGVHVPAEAWDWDRVPLHLRPTFRVVDTDQREVARGKNLEQLKVPLRPSFDLAMQQAAQESGLGTTGRTTWTFDTIEPSFTRLRAGHEVRGFPTLVDEGTTVGLRVSASAEEQEADHRLGVRRLLLIALADPAPEMLDRLDNAAKLGLAASPYPNARALVADCVLAAAGELVDHAPTVRDEAAFATLVAQGRTELAERSRGVLRQVLTVLGEWRPVDKALHGRVELDLLPAMNDLREQLGRLVGPGFVADAGAVALREYPRYLRAMAARIDRLGDRARDRELMARTQPLQEAWRHRVDALPEGRSVPADLRRVRWMLEEYRVSLWAQHLGTSMSVSDTRIRKALG